MTGFKMNISTRVVLALLFLVLSGHAFARDIPIENGAEFLVDACREVVEIYDKHGKAKLLAGQRTSLNEGIKVGYCMGVTKQYSEQAKDCDYSERNWFQMAEKIANTNLTESQLKWKSTNFILRAAYCGL